VFGDGPEGTVVKQSLEAGVAAQPGLPPIEPLAVVRTARIGITRAVELEWRYVESGSSWSSRPSRRAA